MTKRDRSHQRIKAVTKMALLSVSYFALAAASPNEARAQASPPAQQSATQPEESPSPPGTPAQEVPSAQPDLSPSPSVTPAQEQPNAALLPQVTVEMPRSKAALHIESAASRRSQARRSQARRSQARPRQAQRCRRPGRPARHKMHARGRLVSMRTAPRWRPRSTRRWSTFRSRSAS